MIQLYDHQIQLLEKVREALRMGKRSILVVSPTGSGKTIMFSTIASGAEKKGNRVLVLVHRKEILRQTVKSLYRLGQIVGQIASGKPSTPDKIQVAMVGTVVRRLHKIQKPDIIIVDECHHSVGETYRKILASWDNVPIVGFTATPIRLDGKGLDDIYECLIEGPSIAQLVSGGFLSPPIMKIPEREITEQFHMKRGDFDTAEQENVMTKKVIVGDVVNTYRKYLNELPTVCFCVSVHHSKIMADAFNEAGFRAIAVYGDMKATDRDDAIEGLATGKWQVVTSCDVITEGVDVPVMVGAILLRRTNSLSLFLQMTGRALRVAEGKSNAIILDHAGNYYIHGHVLSDRNWTLEGSKKTGKKDEKPPEFTRCPICLTVLPGKPRHCMECGHRFETEEEILAKTRKTPEQIEGELRDVLGSNVSDTKELASFLANIQSLPAGTKQKAVLSQCYRIGDDKDKLEAMRVILGYKKGWTHFVYNRVKNKQKSLDM